MKPKLLDILSFHTIKVELIDNNFWKLNNYKLFLNLFALSVLAISETTVIGPTPPGTGVMKLPHQSPHHLLSDNLLLQLHRPYD
jgi:hypothetical protein